eukprot:g7711.t1
MPSCKNPETGKSEKPRLNDDVAREICAFMGPIPEQADSMRTFEATERMANETRDRDRLKFVDYLLDLMSSEAAKGSKCFHVTRDIVAAGPKTTNGKSVDLVPVFYHLSTAHGFSAVCDAQGGHVAVDSDVRRWNVAATHFPLRVLLCCYDESHDNHWQESSRRMAALTSAGRSKRNTKELTTTSAAIPPQMVALVNTLKQGVERAVHYIGDLALAAFTSGDAEYVLTEEVWNQAPKLPNGKLPPFWPVEVSRMSPYNIERHVDSVFKALNYESGGLETTEVGRGPDDEDLFPVTIIPSIVWTPNPGQ